MIAELRREISEGDLTLGEIFDILKTNGHDLVILFLCLPFLQPIPLLGLSTPLGALMIVGSVLKFRGKAPWIPASWRDKDFSGPAMRKTLEVAEKVLRKTSGLLHRRWGWLVRLRTFQLVNLLVVCISAFLLALPLPVPFSNTVPTWVILASTLGQLEEDGLWILISYLIFLVCLSLFGGLALGVIEGIGLVWQQHLVSP